jgi:hypothetical protein
MHKVKNISWEGCCWGVLADHMKVAMEFNLCIQDDKENIETLKLCMVFSGMVEGWQVRAIRLK